MSYIIILTLLINIINVSLEQPPDSPISIIAQALGLQNESTSTETENGTVSGQVGNFEKYHNATEPSFLYIVQLELKASRVDEPYADIEKRLDKLVEMAFALAGYKHKKQTPPAEITTSNLGYNTKILKKRSSGEYTYIHFVTYAGNEAILGEVVADDMTLLSKSQISATLRYPLSKIISDRDIEIQSSTKLWFLIAIFGIGIILIGLGWLCLFLFFNVCSFGYSTDQEKYLIRDSKEEMQKKRFDMNPKSTRVTPAAQQPNDALPSDGSNSAVTTKKQQRLNKTTYTEAQLKLKRELDKEQARIRNTKYYDLPSESKKSAHTVSLASTTTFDKPVNLENKNAEMGQSGVSTKSEKKRRHTTKIGPITAVTATTATTTTTTNEQERETSEISRVSSVATTSNPEMDEFDVSNLPETSLKILKKKKGNDDNDEVKSEPESDYGSSLDGEKSKDDDGLEQSFNGEHRVRPMTAKRQRTSLFGGAGMDPLPAQPRAWTVYQAGDMVEEFWNNRRMYSHPTPGSPTEDGIIEMVSSSNIFRYV